jgi:hypothetical protein
LWGGERLKFGDVVTAVASLIVILVLVTFPMTLLSRSVLDPSYGGYVSVAVSFLITAIIVGYIFAGKIAEARLESVSKIAVLSAALMVFYVISFPALADWNPLVKESYQAANPGSTLSTSEWLSLEDWAITQTIFLYVVMVLVLAFIGLYAGSMLRKPKKNQK